MSARSSIAWCVALNGVVMPGRNATTIAARRAGGQRHRHLVVRTPGGEHAIRDGDRQTAGLGEPACDAHHVRLGHSDLEEAVRKLPGERQDIGVLREVSREDDDVPAPAAELDERRRERRVDLDERRQGGHWSSLAITSPTLASSPSCTSTSFTVPALPASTSKFAFSDSHLDDDRVGLDTVARRDVDCDDVDLDRRHPHLRDVHVGHRPAASLRRRHGRPSPAVRGCGSAASSSSTAKEIGTSARVTRAWRRVRAPSPRRPWRRSRRRIRRCGSRRRTRRAARCARRDSPAAPSRTGRASAGRAPRSTTSSASSSATASASCTRCPTATTVTSLPSRWIRPLPSGIAVRLLGELVAQRQRCRRREEDHGVVVANRRDEQPVGVRRRGRKNRLDARRGRTAEYGWSECWAARPSRAPEPGTR